MEIIKQNDTMSSARQLPANSARSQQSQVVDLGLSEASEDEQYPMLRAGHRYSLQQALSRTTQQRGDQSSSAIEIED
jgi:hypothetical protein